ncbi:hypothetical protein D0867_13212 [Hortaea werneckii]|uniref:Xylanolytic transcriptional activator regulatory domain-containing protein n=1 Tax=Hortaea werneckii TaxID=91943 RepID=A0A3M6ZUI3_HORWE|nr:hypothetical protein D0867_13212 [Hortaea werneckii]RMY18881.1 hypothetical protein D0866_13026 [Hortaea werneckii]
MMLSPPSPVIDSLRAAEPHKVEERAWLVLFYGVILTAVRAKDPSDDFTSTRLKHNLWLAFNDVRILLEPSDVNIQALMMLACHVEDFTPPSLCWMLVNNACRLLQNAGITDRRLDPQTKDRRRKTFWALNMLDKTLALTFGRPPTFHRAFAREIDPPPLMDMMAYKPHRPPESIPSSFGAHHFHHLFLLSHVMGDIWHCLYEEDYSLHTIKQQRKELDNWYFEAMKVLEAALLVEKPFLSQASVRSLELGLRTMHSGYLYLSILLTRTCPELRDDCVLQSREMLCLLEDMVAHSEEVYNGIIWTLLCWPFTPFLTLFGEILTHGASNLRQARQSLEAMEHLPVFLTQMGKRNALARQLEVTASTLLTHAWSVIYPTASGQGKTATSPSAPTAKPLLNEDQQPVGASDQDMGHFHDDHDIDTSTVPFSEDFLSWPDDLFGGDATFDWFAWEKDFLA